MGVRAHNVVQSQPVSRRGAVVKGVEQISTNLKVNF